VRIAAVAHDPGGANAVGAVVAALRLGGVSVHLCAKGPAVRRLAELGVEAEAISEPHAPAVAALRGELLLAGTSAADSFELDAAGAFAARGLPTVAVLDYPANYAARFRRGPRDAAFWPRVVTALDDRAAAEMVADGVPLDRVRVIGQPYLAWLLRRGRPRRRRSSFRRRILFASQPGAGELQALAWVAAGVRALGPRAALTVRFHPRQQNRGPSLRCLADLGLDAEIDDRTPTLAAIEDHEVILGVTSTILLEAALLGRAAASVLVPDVADGLAWSRPALGPALTTPEEVARFLAAPTPATLDAPFVDAHRDADLRAAALCRSLAAGAREAA
jgi:hypothetical protein